jgi:hypothetical protein
MKPVSSLSNPNNTFTFVVRGSYNCDTADIVYLLQCKICSARYIGETRNSFRKRFHGHTSEYNADLRRLTDNLVYAQVHHPIAVHYRDTGHRLSDFTAVVMKAKFKSDLDRKFFESFLISKFDTFHKGLNQSAGIYAYDG